MFSQSLPQQCPFWSEGPWTEHSTWGAAFSVWPQQWPKHGRAFPQFPGKTSHRTAEVLTSACSYCGCIPIIFRRPLLLEKKEEAKCFLRLETNWSWAGCIQSWMHPWTHQNCIKERLQGGACPSRDDFTAPRGVTGTSTNGTGGGHACDSTTYHWSKVMTLGLWSQPPATTPHCCVCIQHTSSSYNNIHCISYFTSKNLQAVLALRNCSVTITFVKKRWLSKEWSTATD